MTSQTDYRRKPPTDYRRKPPTDYQRKPPTDYQRKPPTKPKYDPIVNGLPGKVFALVLGMWSIAINMKNVYAHFAPAASDRFIATGILNFISALPVFSLLAFLFRAGMAVLAFLLFKIMREKRLMTNAIWLIIWTSCLYAAVVGLGQVILTFPLLLAAYAVAALQYMEIIFWNAKKPGAHLWALVIATYAVEIWLQYDMMPFHTDYDTTLGLMSGLMGLGDFNWAGFQPIQCLFAGIGVFGIEISERILRIVERYA